MARTPPSPPPSVGAKEGEHITVLDRGPVPEVNLGAAVGARVPLDARAGVESASAVGGFVAPPQSIYAGGENPSPQTGNFERERLDDPDPEREAKAPPVQRLVVANRGGKRVQIRAPGNPTGGAAATLPFGKVVDSLNYDFGELRRGGVILVSEEKFAEMSLGG